MAISNRALLARDFLFRKVISNDVGQLFHCLEASPSAGQMVKNRIELPGLNLRCPNIPPCIDGIGRSCTAMPSIPTKSNSQIKQELFLRLAYNLTASSSPNRKRVGRCSHRLHILNILLFGNDFNVKLEWLELWPAGVEPRVDVEQSCGLNSSLCLRQCPGRNSNFNSITTEL